MNFGFGLNYNYWEIYNIIIKYYPVGINKHNYGEYNPTYGRYTGIRDIEELLVQSIHNEQKFNETWVRFTRNLSDIVDRNIVGNTMGQAPSLSAYIKLETTKIDSWILIKELHFTISLLGNFYSIYGITRSAYVDGNKTYDNINVITTSPYLEFEDVFQKVESCILEKYNGYKIIPYSISRSRIPGLQVNYCDLENCTIRTALFNDYLDRYGDISVISTRGNDSYGNEVWRTDGLGGQRVKVCS